MKEVFEALANIYKGSPLEEVAGEGKLYTYLVPEGIDPPYVVMTMAPSPITRPMSSGRKVEPHIFITPVSSHKKGQGEINDMKSKALETFDDARLTIAGYRLVNIEPVEMQQILDVDDPDNLLWQYPIKFKINIE